MIIDDQDPARVENENTALREIIRDVLQFGDRNTRNYVIEQLAEYGITLQDPDEN